jgi:hypothetical protein
VHQLIDAICERCDRVQAQCAPPAKPKRRPGSAAAAESGSSPVRLTIRSSLNFETGGEGHQIQQQRQQQQQQQQSVTEWSQHGPASSAWAGAGTVDLNPGRNFPPGSPQRVAAAAPRLPSVLAQLEQLRGDVHALDLGRLTHREVLQVSGLSAVRGGAFVC